MGRDVVVRLTTVLGFDRIPIVSHYLGLPLFRSNKISDFSFLMDKLDRKLAEWKSKLLSKASRLTVCNRIDAKIRRFWWGTKDENSRTLCFRAWESLCIPKSFGGLGLWRSAEMNRALLAKWCWNLLSGHTSWCLLLLRGKYLRDSSFLCVVAKPTDSLFWKSILAMKPLILKGVCIHLGRGDWVDLWLHPWVPKHPTFRPQPTCTRQPGFQVVADLLLPNGNWNMNKLHDCFSPANCLLIQDIHRPRQPKDDIWIWTPSVSGKFSTKSA
ncbi:hypothetical protein UlMin_014967 [Ulmus minor]